MHVTRFMNSMNIDRCTQSYRTYKFTKVSIYVNKRPNVPHSAEPTTTDFAHSLRNRGIAAVANRKYTAELSVSRTVWFWHCTIKPGLLGRLRVVLKYSAADPSQPWNCVVTELTEQQKSTSRQSNCTVLDLLARSRKYSVILHKLSE